MFPVTTHMARGLNQTQLKHEDLAMLICEFFFRFCFSFPFFFFSFFFGVIIISIISCGTLLSQLEIFQQVWIQSTKRNKSARQTRDTPIKTWITYSNSTWHASKYKVYPPQKVCPQKRMPPVAYIYPPFQAHSAKQVCTGIWQNQFLFFNGFFNTCTCLQYLRSSTPSEINHPVLGLTERP